MFELFSEAGRELPASPVFFWNPDLCSFDVSPVSSNAP